MGKAFQFLMFMVAFPFLFVNVAHSLFHDPFGFPFQFPGFLVATVFGQFLDFACLFLGPVLESLFAVVFTFAMVMIPVAVFVMMASMAISAFAIAFPVENFLGYDLAYLMAQFLGFLVFTLLLERLYLPPLLADPLAQLAFVLFDSFPIAFFAFTFAFPSFSFFRDKVIGCYAGKQYAEDCVCGLHFHGDAG